VDCGGTKCPKCAIGAQCRSASDCSSGGCSQFGLCFAASNATAAASSTTKSTWGIVVGVIGGVILIVGGLITWKCWIPAVGDNAYDTAVGYAAANHEGVEMNTMKSDRGISVVDTPHPDDPQPHEEDMYVS